MVPQRAARTSAAPAAVALRDARRPRPERDGGRPDSRTPHPSVRGLVSCATVAVLVALLFVTSTGAAAATDGTADGAAVAVPASAQGTAGTPVAAVARADSDGDGLPLARERELGTNPYDADTDGDGLADGPEVGTYSTNPTDRDTDGDGLSDGAEVNTHGTSPVTADSDGDGTIDEREVQAGTNPRQGDGQSAGDAAAESLLERTPVPLLVVGGVLLVLAAGAGWEVYRWYRSPVVVKISEQ